MKFKEGADSVSIICTFFEFLFVKATAPVTRCGSLPLFTKGTHHLDHLIRFFSFLLGHILL